MSAHTPDELAQTGSPPAGGHPALPLLTSTEVLEQLCRVACVAVVRHTERPFPTGISVAETRNVMSTPRGRELAMAFGRRLPADIRVVCSPVPRCVETAACMLAGASAESIVIDRRLELVPPADWRLYAGLIDTLGWAEVTRRWLVGDGSVGLPPVCEVSQDLLQAVEDWSSTGASVMVTHDLNILALVAGPSMLPTVDVPFLGGVVVPHGLGRGGARG